MSVTVLIENTASQILVENLTTNMAVVVENATATPTIAIAETGVQGPPGPAGTVDPNFILDGGNF